MYKARYITLAAVAVLLPVTTSRGASAIFSDFESPTYTAAWSLPVRTPGPSPSASPSGEK